MELSIEILNDKALSLLKNLEELNLIRLINSKPTIIKKTTAVPVSRFAGRISEATAKELDQQLEQMRSEWQTPSI